MNTSSSPLRRYVINPLIFAVIATLVFQIPILGPLLFLPLIHICTGYEHLFSARFTSTGEHVNIDFAWIEFKTIWAWLFYGSFFFWVGLFLVVLWNGMRMLLSKIRGNKAKE